MGILTDHDHYPPCGFIEAVLRRENQTADQPWALVHAARAMRESSWWWSLPVNEYNAVGCSPMVSGEIEGR